MGDQHHSNAPASDCLASCGTRMRDGLLRALTAGSPTNQNMVLLRTINRETGRPASNDDFLAPVLRDKLMPFRSAWLRRVPGAFARFRRALEHKRLGSPGVVNFVDARTKWIDQAVVRALSSQDAPAIQQVVIIAAGFDTRAYRFGHEGVKFFEIDLPSTSRRKQTLARRLFAGLPMPTFIAANLSTAKLTDVLSSAGFDPAQRTLFTVEGLLYYLPEAAVDALFRSISALAAPGSQVVFDYLHLEDLQGTCPAKPAWKVTASSVAHKGEPFLSGLPSDPAALSSYLANIQEKAHLEEQDESRAAGNLMLCSHLSPREMGERFLPDCPWDTSMPPLLSFYSFATLLKT